MGSSPEQCVAKCSGVQLLGKKTNSGVPSVRTTIVRFEHRGYKLTFQDYSKKSLTEEEASLRLREKEVFAYHYLCGVFRAQGHLTPEKLKLLKEVAAALYIPECRHRAECLVALNNWELREIAKRVAGPDTEVEWMKETVDITEPVRPVRINSSSLRLADAMAAAVRAELDKLEPGDNGLVDTVITLNRSLYDEEPPAPRTCDHKLVEAMSESSMEEASIKIEEGITEDEEKEDLNDDDTSSSLSSASDDYETRLEEETQPEVQEVNISKEELDSSLMPPPPPVIVNSSPTQTSPLSSPTTPSYSPPAVITVPPPSDIVVATPPNITASETLIGPEIIQTPVASPELSEEEAKAQADFLSSLPPLVVVPPPDPSETSALSSPTHRSPSLVLSPRTPIQIREDATKRKRSVSQSHDTTSLVTTAKTIALSSYSKMTPVMVPASTGSSQGQVKVTPIISRSTMSTTPQTQKVIIVSNNPTPTSSASMIQRSLNVPMGSLGLPIIQGSQPRLQPVIGQNASGGAVRPKMVTVPAKCRAKGSNMVNLQLKNTIAVKQDNVTIGDTNVKRLPGPAKILPKPPGSMFLVNTGGGHNLATAVGCKEAGKQNVVIVQKGAKQRTLTLSNPNKDLMQKLMTKKCVVIQKVMSKNSPHKPPSLQPSTSTPQPQSLSSPPQPQLQQPPPVISAAGNTVVLDLSQEEYRQNLGDTTVRDILQAAGIFTESSSTMAGFSESSQVSAAEGEWLPSEASKSLSLEEVSLPLSQSESFVTLDEAVEMLEEQDLEGGASDSESEEFTEMSSEEVLTVTSDLLSSDDMTVVAGQSESLMTQIVMEASPSEVAADLACISQSFLHHKDGAVSIQHSNIDVPANMSLEDYSSQQMDN